jgi:AraC-like DNA-binding protein
VGIDKAALQLGLSRSTLQRYLKGSGTSYQDVLEQVRKAVACDLLENSATPVGEVAELLGYAHVGNFTRAFIRWTGQPPTAYRD